MRSTCNKCHGSGLIYHPKTLYAPAFVEWCTCRFGRLRRKSRCF